MLALAAGGLTAVGLCLFVAIQLVPVARTNPPVLAEPAWDSAETRALAGRACFDCHSNETQWPPYARIAPMSWLVARDVSEGREELNFSEWGRPGEDNEEDEDSTEDVVEVILEGEMPPASYLLLHPEARLTGEEQRALMEGLRQSLR
jgi:hypothetical protein